MDLRRYQAADLEGCLALFDSNLPTFFAPHERAEFIEFLANTTDPYFVVVDEQGRSSAVAVTISSVSTLRQG
ncbi:MAG: hypothetical protein R3E79_58905 [Caldilineaceae bacterium]